jgi:predicted transcriptional regulator
MDYNQLRASRINKITPNFEPSGKILVRIMEILTKKGGESKTALSLDSNLNYSRLAKHIVWMEKKGFVKSEIKQSKIIVDLTTRGREFSIMFANA